VNSILTIIPARRDSEGILKKNKKLLRGTPLISYSLRIAQEIQRSYSNMEFVLSTNDPEIIDIAFDICDRKFDLRPEVLSSSTTLISDVVKYELAKASEKGRKYDSILLLQPTSPLRKLKDVKSCLQFWNEEITDSVISVSQSGNANLFTSYYTQTSLEGFAQGAATFDSFETNRQKHPKVLSRNGAIYLVDTKIFLSENRMYTRNPWCYEMPRERSFNLDDKFDWELLEAWMISKEIDFDNFL
jgi:CMP-N,N'-diacetyllegionaminic acid synthase